MLISDSGTLPKLRQLSISATIIIFPKVLFEKSSIKNTVIFLIKTVGSAITVLSIIMMLYRIDSHS